VYVEHILDLWTRDGDVEAIVQGDRRFTRAGARGVLLRLAGALRDAGLRPGDAVGLFLANRPESVLTQLAVHLIGCRVVFLPPEPGPGELAALVRQAQLAALVFDPAFTDRVAALLDRDAAVGRLFALGSATRGEDLPALAARGPVPTPEQVTASLPGTDVVTIFYTGGTSGRPKLAGHGPGVYEGLLALVRRAPGPLMTRFLASTLVTHGSGHASSLLTLMGGGTLVVLPAFDADAALRTIRAERVDATFLVPPMLYELLDHPGCRADPPPLAWIGLGGAAVSPTRLRQALDLFGPVVSQIYAQSECLGITTFEPADLAAADARRLRSCGRPIPGARIRIVGADGAEVPVGTVGEVTVRSSTAMLGYYRDPERTAEAFADGWLRTGDLGYLDDDGFLYLVDRARDIIVTGRTSDNVYSRMLEDFLESRPGIRAAAAVGVPDERYGEAVAVFLTLAPGARPDPDGLRRAVAAELGDLYVPRDVTVLPTLPRTRVGKVDKKLLRQRDPAAGAPDPTGAGRPHAG
jgi:fatty-acyl-CoA synthase